MKTIMIKILGKHLYFILPFLFYNASAQNLLDTSSWTLGSGSVQGYLAHGSENENWRILGENNKDEETVLWEARNDASNNEDGGWNTSLVPVDDRKDYRLTVWIKKTNSEDGITSFGCYGSGGFYDIATNRVDSDPFFFSGDLPVLNRWYLVSGYVYNREYYIFRSSSDPIFDNNPGIGVFDGVTGKKVDDVKSFRMSWGNQGLGHRTYLSFDTNVGDRQYMFAPRLELVDERMPTIPELLGANPDSQLNFFYDLAGNQKTRLYCSNGICQRNSTRNSNNEQEKESISAIETSLDDKTSVDVSKDIMVSPNPAKDRLNITLRSDSDIQFVDTMSIHSLSGALLKTHPIGKTTSKVQMDISDLSSGTYLLHMHTSDGSSETKKIIKL